MELVERGQGEEFLEWGKVVSVVVVGFVAVVENHL
jgi:hypothetical protein